ncbi:MAG: family 43 glycosylhydrolase [Lachnospiraceae bacterium]|nr:family 43 glycosylhydrolase [Lachnospiraceae bacterium]
MSIDKKLKAVGDHNPCMTWRFGADPWALVYDRRVYLYMTADAAEYDADGKLITNNYSSINTINVISSADLVNWTDHGFIRAAGNEGAAKWGGNSWAPAAAYKKINGKDKFFLYFANSGNGIAVLESDSPTGPFVDPIGKALISRDTPNCASVTWLFDPAVLTDDDGNSYLYVGGGVPSPDKASDPGTARMVKLGDDMISLDGEPVAIEGVKFLFEDSGINRIGDKYYYSYCSNFSMKEDDVKELGFENGEIITMESDAPLGQFKFRKGVLKNPGAFFGMGGNNHHCMFEFKGKFYVAYHARILEEAMGMDGGYRSTNIDFMGIDADGGPAVAKGTRKGAEQVEMLDPYTKVSAATMGNAAGIDTVSLANKDGSAPDVTYGEMILTGIHTGSWTGVMGADLGTGSPKEIAYEACGTGKGSVSVRIGDPEGEEIANISIDVSGSGISEFSAPVKAGLTGVVDLYFVFEGEGYMPVSWVLR